MPDNKDKINIAVSWYIDELKKEGYYGEIALTFKAGEIVFVRKNQTIITDTIICNFEKVKK